MDSRVWGNLFWNLFNDVCVIRDFYQSELSPADKQTIKQFFYVSCFMLPCKHCRKSYTRYIKNNPPKFPYIRWVFDLHNKVNRKLKRTCTLKYKIFEKRCLTYSSFGSNNQLWDLFFIFAFNYEPHKLQQYRKFNKTFKRMARLLVIFRHYNKDIENIVKKMRLNSKYCALKSVICNRRSPYPMMYWVEKISHAKVIHDNEELQRLCGHLFEKMRMRGEI